MFVLRTLLKQEGLKCILRNIAVRDYGKNTNIRFNASEEIYFFFIFKMAIVSRDFKLKDLPERWIGLSKEMSR
jgi:hypothetical protein